MKLIYVAALASAMFAMSEVVVQADSEKLIHAFCKKQSCADGAYPIGNLVNVKGTLYGVTAGGGSHNAGTIFAYDTLAGTIKVAYSFAGGTDGTNPVGTLIKVKGTLYGTTSSGGGGGCGNAGCGTVFAFNLKTGTETTLHAFAGGFDGQNPSGGLAFGYGQLHGFTQLGGGSQNCTNGCGTYFELDPNSGAETVIAFDGGIYGENPVGDLIFPDGNFYGVTNKGGDHGFGALVEIDGAFSTISVLHSFLGEPDGSIPTAGVSILNTTLYGTSSAGGSGCGGSGCGILYSFNSSGYNIVHYFAGGTDTANPSADLLPLNKALYGTGSSGGGTGCFGGFGCGTVFKINPKNGAETILHSFSGVSDGAFPQGGLLAVNGVLYGTTNAGIKGQYCGSGYGCGTLYSINP